MYDKAFYDWAKEAYPGTKLSLNEVDLMYHAFEAGRPIPKDLNNEMLELLKHIEYALSVYELVSVDDNDVLKIHIRGEIAKDIVKTITAIVT